MDSTGNQARLRLTRTQALPGMAILAVAYFAAGKLGLSLAVAQNLTLVSPATGIALSAVLLWGYRCWPSIALGSFLVAFTLPETSFLVALGTTLGNTLQAVAAASLLRRSGNFRNSLDRVQDVFALLLYGALLSTALSPTFGVTSLCLDKIIPWSNYGTRWWTWWLGDVMGVLLLAPLMLTWGMRPQKEKFEHATEGLVLLVLVTAVSLLVFGGRFTSQATNFPLAYIVFPFVIWAAFRFGALGAATTTCIFSGIAIWQTLHGYGPFASNAPTEVLILWYAFAGVLTMTSLVLAAAIAERKLAEMACRVSETRYHNLFTRSPISIWEEDFSKVGNWLDQLRAGGVSDLAAYLQQNPEAIRQAVSLVRILDVNEATLSVFQAEHREELLAGLHALIGDRSDEFFAQELMAIWDGKNRLDLEITRTTLKGNRIDYILHWLVALKEGRLDLAHVIVAITDITERKRAEEESGRVARFLETLINNAPVAIQIYDRRGEVQLWNPASAALYGFTAEEIKGRRIQATILAPKEVEVFEAGMARTWESQQAAPPEEYTVLRKDGTSRRIFSAMFPLVEEGKSGGICCMAVDITERKQAEKALRESELRFRSLFENSPLGIAIARHGTVLHANQAYLKMFGYDNVRDVSLLHQIAPQAREAPTSITEGEGSDGEEPIPTSYEAVGQRKDGSVFPFHVEVARVGLPDGMATVAFINNITARKRAEEALREQEESFRVMFASNPLPMWVHDLETLQFLEVNEAAIQHYGYSREEFLSMRTTDIRAPDDTREWRKRLGARSSQPSFSGPWRQRLKNGQIIDVQFLSHSLEFLGRKALLIVAEDITDQKSAEEALRLSEERFRIAAQSASDLIYEWDIWSGRMNWFGNIAEQLGLASGEFPRTKSIWEQIIHPEDRERVMAALDRGLNAKEPYCEEYRVRRKDGIYLYWMDRGTALWKEENSLYKWIGVITDITERKQAEEEQQKLVALVENSSDLIGMASLEGYMLYLNEAGRKLVGWAETSELAQMRLSEFYPEEDRVKFLETILPEIMSSGRWEGEFQLRHFQTQKAIDVQTSLFLVRHPRTSEPLCLATVARDVTERKLLEVQFRQAQKMEAVGRLAGGIAHDFNNLLMAILGYSDLVLEELSSDHPLINEVQQIHKAGERAVALTHQLLAFSRKQRLQAKLIDLNAVVEDMKHMLRRLIGEDIELATVLDPQLGHVKADRGQIEQVIVNLVINARDSMPEGGKLTLETKNIALDDSYLYLHPGIRAGSYVMLNVEDTGSGMTAEIKSHLFEPFFTTKEVGKGTGLGLSTVYGIVKQSGGDIQVYSEVGLGTTFKVYLPRVDAPAEVVSLPAVAPPSPRGTETILLAEDEEAVRLLLSRILQKHGYTVLEAGNGSDALRMCEQYPDPIHLLITDLVMPQLSGRELAKRLSVLRPATKVLLISGYTGEAVVDHDLLESRAAFIQKPFDGDTLLSKVRELLSPVETTQ